MEGRAVAGPVRRGTVLLRLEMGGSSPLQERHRRGGDEESERRALERLIDTDPAEFEALDRLVELAVKHGQTEQATELTRRRTEIETLEARYLKLFDRNQPLRDAAEMAQLAERIGRRFEAKAFRTVADAIIGY
jgi:enediyne biosynthesis protein E4